MKFRKMKTQVSVGAIASFLAFSLLPESAWSWTKVGNGGDVVVCTSVNGSQTVELLDVYEARETYGRSPELPPGIHGAEALALKLAERLKTVAPARAQMFEVYIANFAQEVLFVNYDLQDIPDHGYLKIPANCKIKQLIVNACSNHSDSFGDLVWDPYAPPSSPPVKWNLDQKKVISWNQVCKGRYTINRPLWQAMPEEMKAMAITHEAFMRDYRHMGDPGFEFDGPYHPVRYFNELLFTNQLASYDFHRFQKLYGSQGRAPGVEETHDGRLILKKEQTANLTTAYMVPHLLMPYRDRLGNEVRLSESRVDYLEQQTFRGPRSTVHFTTASRIRQRHSERGDDLDFSGDVILDLTGSVSGLRVVSGSLPGYQGFATGFSHYCEQNELGQPVKPVKAKISNLAIEEVQETLPDGTRIEKTKYRYTPSSQFSVDEKYFKLEVLAKQIEETTQLDAVTHCKDGPRLAKSIWFYGKGVVYFKGRWKTVHDALLNVDLVTMRVVDLVE